MWDKLAIREKERQLGILFGSVLIGWCIYAILVEHFPTTAKVVGAIFGGVWLVFLVRVLSMRAWGRSGPAPTGPLSTDERSKAVSKLKRPLPPIAPKSGG